MLDCFGVNWSTGSLVSSFSVSFSHSVVAQVVGFGIDFEQLVVEGIVVDVAVLVVLVVVAHSVVVVVVVNCIEFD